MKLLHIITTIERGGAENAITTLAQEQVKRGYDVTVMPIKGEPELKNLLENSGVKVDLSLIGLQIIRQCWLFKKLEKEYSVIHAHLPRAELLARLCIRKNPYFVTRHNSEPFFPRAPRFVSTFLSKAVVNRSKSVVAISNAVRNFLIRNRELVSTKDCVVIPYGYQRKTNFTERSIEKEFIGINSNELIRLITVSRLEKQKNLILQLKAVRCLVNLNFNVHLTILGEGSERSSLTKEVHRLDIDNRVDMPGRIQDVFSFLTNSHLFLLTSFYEGFGLALLEAMDAGIPIVAAKTSSIPEVLGPSHPGLFESNSLDALVTSILKIVKSEEIAKVALGFQLNQLKKFSVEEYFKKHHALYSRYQ